MKLFQKLLLAPAAIGFLSPINVSASEANLMDVSNYSQVDVEVTQDTFKPLSSKNPLLAGGEGLGQDLVSDFDGDSFSSTTSASFSSDFLFGSKNGASNEKTFVGYQWEVGLNTSFNGNDSLDVVLNAGNSLAFVEDLDTTNNATVSIDSISYTTQLGEKLSLSWGMGPSAAGSALYASACVYGAQTDVLSNCGVASSNIDEGLGTGIGASFDLGSGFAVAVAYEGQQSQGKADPKGLLTNEGVDAYGIQASYVTDNYGFAIAYANIENHVEGVLDADEGVTTSTGFNAFYAPELDNFPTISVGLETSHDDSEVSTKDNKTNYFVGVQWDGVGQGTLGAAYGTKAPYVENADTENMYEVFYSYNYADGITITPLIFVKENAAANTDDETGLALITSFSF